MKGGYLPVNQPWQGTVVFISVLQNILLWTQKTPVPLWFMNPSDGIWVSNICLLQPLTQRIQILLNEWAARMSIATRRTWLLEWQLLLLAGLISCSTSKFPSQRRPSGPRKGMVFGQRDSAPKWQLPRRCTLSLFCRMEARRGLCKTVQVAISPSFNSCCF